MDYYTGYRYAGLLYEHKVKNYVNTDFVFISTYLFHQTLSCLNSTRMHQITLFASLNIFQIANRKIIAFGNVYDIFLHYEVNFCFKEI